LFSRGVTRNSSNTPRGGDSSSAIWEKGFDFPSLRKKKKKKKGGAPVSRTQGRKEKLFATYERKKKRSLA